MSIVRLHNIDIPVDAVAELCRRYHVRELSLFGSILRDDFRDDSDIDVLVEFEPDALVGFIRFFEFQEELEQLLGRSVDLISKRGLKPYLRPMILSTSQVIYAA